jgi:hypothetical protein
MARGNAPRLGPVTVRLVAGPAILAGLAGLLLFVTGFGAPCGSGRTCVSDASLSVELPTGWSVIGSRGHGELFRAVSSSPSVGIVVEPGDALLDGGPFRTLDEVAAAVTAQMAPRSTASFTQIGESVVDRQTLPIGPSVRLRMTAFSAFIMSFNQSSTFYLFFVDGRLLALEYDVAVGEGEPTLPAEVDGGDLVTIRDSLRPMTPAIGVANQNARAVPWMLAASLGVLGIAAIAHFRATRRASP